MCRWIHRNPRVKKLLLEACARRFGASAATGATTFVVGAAALIAKGYLTGDDLRIEEEVQSPDE